MELTFFIAARLVLCFGFVTKSVLITHPCLTAAEGCWHSFKIMFVTVLPRGHAEGGQDVGKSHSQDRWHTEQRDPHPESILLSYKV